MRSLVNISIGFLLMVSLGSCGVFNRIKKEKVTEKSNYYKEYYRDSLIVVPGGSVTTTLDSGAYRMLLKKLAESRGDTVIYQNVSTGVSLRFYQDALGRLTAECNKKDDLINALVKTTESSSTRSETLTKYKQNIPMIGLGAGAMLLLLVLYQLFKKRTN